MIMKFRIAAVLIFLGLIHASSAYAIEVTDEFCDSRARLGTWKRGLLTQNGIDDIANEFDQEHKKLISFLDGQPPTSSELIVLNKIGVKPFSVVKVGANFVGYKWEIPGGKYNLGVSVDFYKGCVVQILLMNMATNTFYHRRNELPTKP